LKIAIVGAAGRTGKQLVKQALNRGHVVRALAHHRLPDIKQAGVTWFTGSVVDLSTLKRLIDGCDLAISAIGPRPGHEDVCSTATKGLLEAGVRRLIVVSGMAVTLPGDRKGFIDRFSSMMVAAMAPKVFEDKVRELELLSASAIDWTAVRVGMLTDSGAIRPAKADLRRPPGIGINTASLAAFCLDEAEQRRFSRSAPFVSV
jgi:putative NADH-flavin reductase